MSKKKLSKEQEFQRKLYEFKKQGWLDNLTDEPPGFTGEDLIATGGVLLRVEKKGKKIRIGACDEYGDTHSMPLDAAKKILAFRREKLVRPERDDDYCAEDYKSLGLGTRIGMTAYRYYSDPKFVIVGCMRIPVSEIDRIAKKLKL